MLKDDGDWGPAGARADGALAQLCELALRHARAPADWPVLLDLGQGLPDGLTEFLEVLNSQQDAALAHCAGRLGVSEAELRRAGVALVKQILFADETDPYRTLGVGRNASLEHIRSNYRTLMGLFHPDRQRDGAAVDPLPAARISTAFQQLKRSAKKPASAPFKARRSVKPAAAVRRRATPVDMAMGHSARRTLPGWARPAALVLSLSAMLGLLWLLLPASEPMLDTAGRVPAVDPGHTAPRRGEQGELQSALGRIAVGSRREDGRHSAEPEPPPTEVAVGEAAATPAVPPGEEMVAAEVPEPTVTAPQTQQPAPPTKPVDQPAVAAETPRQLPPEPAEPARPAAEPELAVVADTAPPRQIGQEAPETLPVRSVPVVAAAAPPKVQAEPMQVAAVEIRRSQPAVQPQPPQRQIATERPASQPAGPVAEPEPRVAEPAVVAAEPVLGFDGVLIGSGMPQGSRQLLMRARDGGLFDPFGLRQPLVPERLVMRFVRSYQQGPLEDLLDLFARDAVTQQGEGIGRIEHGFAAAFQRYPERRMAVQEMRVPVQGPDYAEVELRVAVSLVGAASRLQLAGPIHLWLVRDGGDARIIRLAHSVE